MPEPLSMQLWVWGVLRVLPSCLPGILKGRMLGVSLWSPVQGIDDALGHYDADGLPFHLFIGFNGHVFEDFLANALRQSL